MGTVWRAKDEFLEREIALKMLHRWIVEERDARLRFAREARALARLAHPNIVRIYDFEDAPRVPYLVMELVRGSRLDRHVARRLPLGWAEAKDILYPICQALAFAHRNGVVHCDLKPANVLIDDAGAVVVSDFGLARVLGTGGSISASGMFVGSPEYWAPEQASGGKLTPATDMYALGCILYELITGHLPFEGGDRLAVGYRRVHEAPVDATRYAPTLPDEAASLVRRLLSRLPADRPEADAVLHAVARESLSAGPVATIRRTHETSTLPIRPSAPTRVARERRKRPSTKAVFATAAAFGAALLGTATAVLLTTGHSSALAGSPVKPIERILATEVGRGADDRAVPAATSASVPLTTLSGAHFSVAYPEDWYVESAEEWKNGSHMETTIRNRQDVQTLVGIDVIPEPDAAPIVHARRLEGNLRASSTYDMLDFRRTFFRGHPAVAWEFTNVENGSALRKLYIFFSGPSGNTIGVLTQAPAAHFPKWDSVFDRIRTSLDPA